MWDLCNTLIVCAAAPVRKGRTVSNLQFTISGLHGRKQNKTVDAHEHCVLPGFAVWHGHVAELMKTFAHQTSGRVTVCSCTETSCDCRLAEKHLYYLDHFTDFVCIQSILWWTLWQTSCWMLLLINQFLNLYIFSASFISLSQLAVPVFLLNLLSVRLIICSFWCKILEVCI